MKETTDDIELLNELKNNSQPALSHIFNKYWKELYSYALKFTHDEYAADEIVQKLFIKLWEKRAELTIQSLPQYLYIAVKNGCLDNARAQIKREDEWKHYSQFIPTTFSPEEEPLSAELLDKLRLRLGPLSKKSREIFEKSKIEGLSISEIAERMKLSKKAVEYHLAKVKKFINR